MNSAILNHTVLTVTTSQLRSEGFPETELILTLNSGAKLTELEIRVFCSSHFWRQRSEEQLVWTICNISVILLIMIVTLCFQKSVD